MSLGTEGIHNPAGINEPLQLKPRRDICYYTGVIARSQEFQKYSEGVRNAGTGMFVMIKGRYSRLVRPHENYKSLGSGRV